MGNPKEVTDNITKTGILLQESLMSMTVANLKAVIDRFGLSKAKKSGKKEEIVQSILDSESMKIPEIREAVKRIADFFKSGGKNTFSLFKLNVSPDGIEDLVKSNLASQLREELSHEGSKFKLQKLSSLTFNGKQIFELEFDSPAAQREVVDYYKGPEAYTPVSHCKCLIHVMDSFLLLDIRAPKKVSLHLSELISLKLYGQTPTNDFMVPPAQVECDKNLSAKLKTKFAGRKFKLKVTEDDSVDSEGVFRPRQSEYTTSSHDFDEQRKGLHLRANSEDMAHGLEFTVTDGDIELMSECKIYINFVTHQITFLKLTPLGVYEKVISAILEG